MAIWEKGTVLTSIQCKRSRGKNLVQDMLTIYEHWILYMLVYSSFIISTAGIQASLWLEGVDRNSTCWSSAGSLMENVFGKLRNKDSLRRFRSSGDEIPNLYKSKASLF